MIPVRSLVPLVQVRDVTASIEFYEKLGFAVYDTFVPDGDGAPAWAWLRSDDDANLMIARATAPVPAGEPAVMFYLYADDVHGKHAELREAGIAAGDITYAFYAPRGEFGVSDPDGHLLMITHTR